MPRVSFDDFEPGAVTTYGTYPVTREEIIAFASQYDPQPMHLDEAAAAGTLLGGLGSFRLAHLLDADAHAVRQRAR